MPFSMPDVSGRLHARFALREGGTVMTGKVQTYPLKIAKTFPGQRGALSVCLMDASPGMMAGDRYEMDWHVGDGAYVSLTNQSFTKIHPCGSRPAGLLQTIQIGRNAVMDYRPEPVMPYRDAVFRGETVIRMEPGSLLLMTDILCPGRALRGESFDYRKYDSSLQVDYDGETVYYSRLQLAPSGSQPSGWAGYTHLGSLYVFSDRLTGQHVEHLREQLGATGGTEMLCAAGLTYKHGLIVTVLGTRVWEIQRMFAECAERIGDLFHGGLRRDDGLEPLVI
jgi:urease accessory protein